MEKNPTELTEAEKRAEAQRKVQEERDDLDSQYFVFYATHSGRDCEELAKRHSGFRKWLQSVKYESLKQPEPPASQQGGLYTSRTINAGIIRYLAGDDKRVTGDVES